MTMAIRDGVIRSLFMLGQNPVIGGSNSGMVQRGLAELDCMVAKEINGYTWPERRQIASFQDLKDDGSTACGVWTYTGVFPTDDHNHARSHRQPRALAPSGRARTGRVPISGWGFAWPANRRTIYNPPPPPIRTAIRGRKQRSWCGGTRQRGKGYDSVDFEETKRPDYQPDWSLHPEGMEALDGCSPFTMIADSKSSLFVPSGLKDGPLPTHCEPVERRCRTCCIGGRAARSPSCGRATTILITRSPTCGSPMSGRRTG